MKIEEFLNYDALGLAGLIREGEVTASELLDCTIELIESQDGQINAVNYRMFDEARNSIERGVPEGPFSGVPFLLKDLNLLYAGVPTTNGCRMFADFVPDHDSTLVERHKSAGLVIAGKTNTPELGIAATTESALLGPARNPWDLSFSTGGSSGGAAAAVAAGYVPMAHATDGGGSIRIPASNCGLFGLKPSRARNPQGPDMGEGMAGMATGHCVSWSVRDSAALLDATSGPAPGDPYAAPPLERALSDELGRDPGRLRIAVCTTDFEGRPIDPEAAAAVLQTAKQLEALGHDVEEARPNFDGLSLHRAWRVIPAANLATALRARAQALGREPTPADMEPITWEWMHEGLSLSAADYMETVNLMHAIGRRLGVFLQRYDLLLSATLCRPTLPLGEMSMNTTDVGRYVEFVFGEVAGLTPLFNQTGGAAMSVPLASTASGMPIGIQFGGTIGCEAKLFRLAAQLEQAHPWTRPNNKGEKPSS